jgi:hypothetical protein
MSSGVRKRGAQKSEVVASVAAADGPSSGAQRRAGDDDAKGTDKGVSKVEDYDYFESWARWMPLVVLAVSAFTRYYRYGTGVQFVVVNRTTSCSKRVASNWHQSWCCLYRFMCRLAFLVVMVPCISLR